MNPKFWRKTTDGKWTPKDQPGQDATTISLNAYRDLNVNPDKYAIACSAATKITMLAGSGNTDLKKDKNVDEKDWIPGDWGYLENRLHKEHSPSWMTAINNTIGEEGENIICTGKDVYWGHSNHTPQGIELYKDKAILHSTGDFIDDYAVDPTERNDLSFLFQLDLQDGQGDL